ncbi:MMPL family transporter [Clostridium sp. B9]|uniref:MMPL family transporter n=1 Tax=Clostridium sp. B9 TaxID=3423224 RepID=UPI003D2EDA94
MKENILKKFKFNKKFSFLILIIWCMVVGFLLITAPSLSKLVSEKGGIQLPNDYSSKISDILNSNNQFNSNDSYIAVFHSDSKLTAENLSNIKNTINRLKDNKNIDYVQSITNSFDTPQLKSQLNSSNGETIIALMTIDPKGASVSKIEDTLNKELKTSGVETYVTGQSLIENDVNVAAQKGLNKTQTITVIFIFIVLILLFKSIVTPFIPLLTVGISYLGAQSVVAILADKFNFPLSNYTQIFMICIMFGIGTDYSILLLNRFKEELINGEDNLSAMKTTFTTAGKTVLSSATPVFVVFASLNFIGFNLYRSAVAVAIGILFLILALFTIFPAVMIILGKNIFWPVKGTFKAEENKLWAKLANKAFNKPIPILGIIFAVLLFPILFNNFNQSFNNLNEIGDSYSAKAGFNIIADNFGIGQASPVSIYIENDDDMRKPEYVALMEKLSNDIKNSSNDFKSVLSVTRPTGDRIDEIYVNDQAGQVAKGVDKANNALNEINSGLTEANKKIADSKGKLKSAEEGTEKLQDGTKQTEQGVSELQAALNKLVESLKEEHAGATELKTSIDGALDKVSALKLSKAQLEKDYTSIVDSANTVLENLNKLGSLSGDPSSVNVDTSKLKNSLSSLNSHLSEYSKSHPELANDEDFKKFSQDVSNLNNNTNNLNGTLNNSSEVKAINESIGALKILINTLNDKKDTVINDLEKFNSGISEIENGLNALDKGLGESLSGGEEISSKVPEISNALSQIANGQSQIQNGFKQFSGQINELSEGLKAGSNGITEIQNGLKYANGFINDWSNLSYNLSGICVPVEVFSNNEFKQSLNQYMSPDGKLAVINVITTKNPYSDDAMNAIPELQSIVEDSVKGTKLENANIGVGGMASTSYETKKMADKDYDKALIFVIVGVFITLIIILRSLTMPIYLMISLLLTYFTSISVVQFIVTKIMKYPGISWITSFFGFVVLMALGIDYSIFIMTKFNQDLNGSIKDRIIRTMRTMGGVIISAVIILSGTFAALLPSGVLSLIEISMVVLTGILLYVVFVLPLFIPAMVKIFGKLNWWPFKPAIAKETTSSSDNVTVVTTVVTTTTTTTTTTKNGITTTTKKESKSTKTED